MYEVDCPGCTHPYDVDEAARAATCPHCGLAVDLVDEQEEFSGSRSAGEAAFREDPLPTYPDKPFVEVPCPLCTGPLLLAMSDTNGLCPHCETPLAFEEGSARPFESARGHTAAPEAEPGRVVPHVVPPAKEASPAHGTVVPDEHVTPAVPAREAPIRFDPMMRVTPALAPLVETQGTTLTAPATTGHPATPEDAAHPETIAASEPLQADAPHAEAAEQPGRTAGPMPDSVPTSTPATTPAPRQDPPPTDEASPAREAVVSDEPLRSDVPPERPSAPRFDPNLEVRPEHAPVVSCGASPPAKGVDAEDASGGKGRDGPPSAVGDASSKRPAATRTPSKTKRTQGTTVLRPGTAPTGKRKATKKSPERKTPEGSGGRKKDAATSAGRRKQGRDQAPADPDAEGPAPKAAIEVAEARP